MKQKRYTSGKRTYFLDNREKKRNTKPVTEKQKFVSDQMVVAYFCLGVSNIITT